jgi:hypothetical protein
MLSPARAGVRQAVYLAPDIFRGPSVSPSPALHQLAPAQPLIVMRLSAYDLAMRDRVEAIKEALSRSIGLIEKSHFSARLQIYDRARHALAEIDANDEDRILLESVIRDTEKEIATLLKSDISRLAARAKFISGSAAGIVGSLFFAVQFWNLSFLSRLLSVDPDFLFQFALTLYFIVIGFGLTFDIETQKQIYILDPSHGRIERNSIIAIVLHFFIAAGLFASSRDYLWFAIALTIFHFSGIGAWRVLTHQMMPRIVESEGSASLRCDNFALERLRLARQYVSGAWHGPRHWILTVLVLVFDFVAIPSDAVRSLVSAVSRLIPGSTEAAIASHLAPVAFCIFALTGEVWTMAKRFETRLRLNEIDILERRYDLRKRVIADFQTGDGVIPVISSDS